MSGSRTPPPVEMTQMAQPLLDEFDELVDNMESINVAHFSVPPTPCGLPIHYKLFGWLVMLIFFPLLIGHAFVETVAHQMTVVMVAGRVWKVIKEPGTTFISIPFAECQKIPVEAITHHLRISCPDINGVPVIIEAIVDALPDDPLRFMNFGVDPCGFYGKLILKRLASQYPIESLTHGDFSSLLTERFDVMCRPLGWHIRSFDITSAGYGVELAASMLKRQQAQATVDSRKLIVDGAVGIIADTVDALHAKGLGISDSEASSITRRLLCLMSSKKAAHGIISQ